METDEKEKCVHHHSGGGFVGGLWFAGWLFTLAYTSPVWWKALLGLVIWPYYLGLAVK